MGAYNFCLGLADFVPVDVNVRCLHLLEAVHGLPQHDGGRGQRRSPPLHTKLLVLPLLVAVTMHTVQEELT